MSSGAFLNTFYTTDAGNVVPIISQPETLALVLGGETNAGPAGPAAAGFPSAQVSKGRRSLGINARLVRVKFPPGGAPAGYADTGAIALPWFDPTSFATLSTGATGTYLGSACSLVGKTAESVR